MQIYNLHKKVDEFTKCSSDCEYYEEDKEEKEWNSKYEYNTNMKMRKSFLIMILKTTNIFIIII